MELNHFLLFVSNYLITNYAIFERFYFITDLAVGKVFIKEIVKSILKGKIRNITIECVHTLNHKLKTCDGFGNPKKIEGIITKPADFIYYYIDHYYCKSTEEFINIFLIR